MKDYIGWEVEINSQWDYSQERCVRKEFGVR